MFVIPFCPKNGTNWDPYSRIRRTTHLLQWVYVWYVLVEHVRRSVQLACDCLPDWTPPRWKVKLTNASTGFQATITTSGKELGQVDSPSPRPWTTLVRSPGMQKGSRPASLILFPVAVGQERTSDWGNPPSFLTLGN